MAKRMMRAIRHNYDKLAFPDKKVFIINSSNYLKFSFCTVYCVKQQVKISFYLEKSFCTEFKFLSDFQIQTYLAQNGSKVSK
jgi:hypothetical protein